VETTKLFVEYAPNADGTGMTGTIHRHLSDDGSVGKIIGIASSIKSGRPQDKVLCKIGIKQVATDTTIDIQIEKGKAAISCQKNPTSNVKIYLSTTEGDQDRISLPSAIQQRQNKISDISSCMSVLRGQLDQLKIKIEAIGKDQLKNSGVANNHLNSIDGKVNGAISRITTLEGQQIPSGYFIVSASNLCPTGGSILRRHFGRWMQLIPIRPQAAWPWLKTSPKYLPLLMGPPGGCPSFGHYASLLVMEPAGVSLGGIAIATGTIARINCINECYSRC
jgi:hypothetical protein